jgi:hypothetical protein
MAPAGGGSSHIGRPVPKAARPYVRRVQRGGQHYALTADCTGCHDAHGREAGKLRPLAFNARGEILATRPQNAAERCFGCHAGTDAAPLSLGDPDIGKLFAASAASRHGIGTAPKDRPDLPSLRSSATPTAKLDCVSCHGNPDAAGPRGPHASPFPSLLKAAYGRERDLGTTGQKLNDLCYACHDRRSIEGNQSFPLHREHLRGFVASPGAGGRPAELAALMPDAFPEPRDIRSRLRSPGKAGLGEPAACATCHDPHGSKENPSLVRFDRTVVTPSSVGGVEFKKTGMRRGTCTLTCHGHDHIHAKY